MEPQADVLEKVQAYRLAIEAARWGRKDAAECGSDPAARELLVQLLRALGSIPANIAEGYSRGSYSDRRRFFEYALGSTREAIAWYETLGTAALDERLARLTSVRRLLLTMITNARARSGPEARKFER
jgi:four helix bundle protein